MRKKIKKEHLFMVSEERKNRFTDLRNRKKSKSVWRHMYALLF